MNRKKTVTFVAALVAGCVFSTWAFADCVTQAKVPNGLVNLRSLPSEHATIVDSIPGKTEISLLDHSGNWWFVYAGDTNTHGRNDQFNAGYSGTGAGWIHKSLISCVE